MGLGIISTLKSFAPLTIYGLGIVFFMIALTGRVNWTLMWVTFLLPLRNVIERMQDFPEGKDYLDLLIISMLIGWAVSTLAYRRPFMEKTPLNKIAIVLIIYTYLSVLRGYIYLDYFTPFDFSDIRVQQWKNYCLLPILYFLTVNSIRDKKWVWRILIVICLNIFFTIYYGVDQISAYSSIQSRVKISGTFVFLGPNEVAAFMNQYSVLLLGVFFFLKRSWKKLGLLALFAGGTYCVLFLFSRGAYLGLVAGLFCIFAFRKRILLIPLLAILVLWQVALPEKVKDRIMETTNEYGELDQSNQKRVIVWEQTLELFTHDPIFGVGFGVFHNLGYMLGDTHNIYLKVLSEQGTVGFILFLILIGTFFFMGWRLYKTGDEPLARGLGLGFLGCLCTLLVNNCFGDRWLYLELSSNLWVIAGLVARLNLLSTQNLSSKATSSKKIPTKKSKPTPAAEVNKYKV